MSYSDRVRFLVSELPNRGQPEAYSHTGYASNPICGDELTLFLRLEDGRVVHACFQAVGCPATLAAGAELTILVKDMARKQALEIQVDELIDLLGGLPRHKRHGAELAVRALRAALME